MSTPTEPAGPDPLHDPAQFLELGLTLANSKGGPLALSLAERALARHADAPEWQAAAATILRSEVPDFHVRMLHDGERNRTYRAAIERFAPGRRVLDIGTGSGLLAMMAARAGAHHVYACEANAMLAASARAVIAANGLADRITVFDRHSSALDRERDLDGGVDLVMSEVFSHCLIGEGVLGSIAHARRELAAPGALILPERAGMMVALADFPPLVESIGPVEGFDLAAFAPHLHAQRHLLPEHPGLVLRSPAAELFAFDFADGALPPRGAAEVALTSTGGLVGGLAQWLHLHFADDITYENRPGSGPDLHWMINLAPTERREAPAGTLYRAGGVYAQDTLALWCAGEAGGTPTAG